jgi:hypothetical protein
MMWHDLVGIRILSSSIEEPVDGWDLFKEIPAINLSYVRKKKKKKKTSLLFFLLLSKFSEFSPNVRTSINQLRRRRTLAPSVSSSRRRGFYSS